MKQTLNLSWEYDGQQFTKDVEVGQSVRIGRLDDCDIVIPENRVSRRHAQITGRMDNERAIFELKNLSETNLIFFQSPDEQPPLIFEQSVELPDKSRFILGKVLITAKVPVQSTPDVKISSKLNMVRCSNCREIVDGSLKDCPWCGTTLAFSGTIMS